MLAQKKKKSILKKAFFGSRHLQFEPFLTRWRGGGGGGHSTGWNNAKKPWRYPGNFGEQKVPVLIQHTPEEKPHYSNISATMAKMAWILGPALAIITTPAAHPPPSFSSTRTRHRHWFVPARPRGLFPGRRLVIRPVPTQNLRLVPRLLNWWFLNF